MARARYQEWAAKSSSPYLYQGPSNTTVQGQPVLAGIRQSARYLDRGSISNLRQEYNIFVALFEIFGYLAERLRLQLINWCARCTFYDVSSAPKKQAGMRHRALMPQHHLILCFNDTKQYNMHSILPSAH